jgi:hypothetical protein
VESLAEQYGLLTIDQPERRYRKGETMSLSLKSQAIACRFRRKPATYSDLIAATLPI